MPKKVIAAGLALMLALSTGISGADGAWCSAKSLIKDKSLGKFYGYVIDTNTKKVLLSVRGSQQTPSASVLKLITGASAVTLVDLNSRAQTRVYQSTTEPGTLILVGGGDHTLSAFNPPQYTTYKSPARLSKLASLSLSAITSVGLVQKIVVDESYFDEVGYNRAWKESDRTNGYITAISPLMVDANRLNGDLTSKKYSSSRLPDPALHAGNEFKKALGVQAKKAKVMHGLLEPDAKLIATVRSQPMSVWVDHAMKISDNTETEIIMRHLQKAMDYPTTFAAIEPLSRFVLDYLGVSAKGLVMKDASGLSQQNRVTPKLIASLLAIAADKESPIGRLPEFLPGTHTYGTVAGRFTGANSVTRGSVVAKSGFIPGLSSLAGLVTARDGHVLAFAFFARADVAAGYRIDGGTRYAIDSLVTLSYRCGQRLTR